MTLTITFRFGLYSINKPIKKYIHRHSHPQLSCQPLLLLPPPRRPRLYKSTILSAGIISHTALSSVYNINSAYVLCVGDNKFTVQSIHPGIPSSIELEKRLDYSSEICPRIFIRPNELCAEGRTFIFEEIFVEIPLLCKIPFNGLSFFGQSWIQLITNGQTMRTSPQNILAISFQFIGLHLCHRNYSGMPFFTFQHFLAPPLAILFY